MPAPTYALQAITTKYLGPTNSRGARIKATGSFGRVTVPYDHALSAFENHRAAANAFMTKFGWTGDAFRNYAIGALPNGGYVLAFVTT
jgi:hypothetical protein